MISSNPLFSVIIPLYNKEKEIRRCIQSILNQNFENYEIIIVDDECTDTSVSVVESIKDTRIKLYHQTNMGEHGARNTGIMRSHGNYIAFLDADDEWKSTYLSIIYDLLHRYPNAGLYCTAGIGDFAGKAPTISIHSSGIGSDIDGIINNPFLCSAMDRQTPMTSSSAVIPREIFENVGLFPNTRKAGGDWEMWGRIMLAYPIAYSSKELVILHYDAENRITNNSKNRLIDEHPFIETINNYPELISTSKYTEGLNLFIDYLNISLATMWLFTDEKKTRYYLSRIKHRDIYRGEIIFSTILLHFPNRIRERIHSIMLNLKHKWLN